MNRKTYLRQVKRRLNLPRKWKKRVIRDLAASLDARMENGETEETMLRELGPAKKTAEEFNEQLREYTYRKSPWRFLCLGGAAVAGVLLILRLWLFGILNEILGLSGSHSVGVIGGADGPTAIFVTSEPLVGGVLPYLLIIAGGLLGYWALSRRKQKKG